MYNDKVQNFLKIISQIESSGGKNLNHPLIKYGLQKGQQGIGQYGLLGNTVQEIINRQRNDNTITPDISNLQNLEPDQLKNTIEHNPEIESNLASYLANRALNRQGGNEMAAAYSWNQGTNLSPEKITSEKLLNSDYVGKYNKFKSDDAMNKLSEEEKLKQMANQRALSLLANK